MCNLPHSIYSVEGVRDVDRAAIEGLGIPGYTLMTSAAMEALDEAISHVNLDQAESAIRKLLSNGTR